MVNNGIMTKSHNRRLESQLNFTRVILLESRLGIYSSCVFRRFQDKREKKTGRQRNSFRKLSHKLLTNLASSSRTGEYWPSVVLYGPRCARSVLLRPRANIPRYGPRARLVRGYYFFPRGLGNESCNLIGS